MKYELTIEERDQLMGQLTEEQRHFIHNVLVRGRRTLFARQLAHIKCQFIPGDAELEDIESFIEEWDYIGFTDSGEVSPHTKCECGRSLRYQHQVLHIPTNTMRYFGIEHLQLHTGIDAKTISAIMKGFDVLDGEMTEVLCKYRDGWQLSQHIYQPFPEELEVPQDIQAHLDAKLPLLERHLMRLRYRLRNLEKARREKPPELSKRITKEAPVLSALEHKDPSQSQSVFVFEEAVDNQGVFVFEELEDNQGAFVFEELEAAKQEAFVFEEEAEPQKSSFRVNETDKRPTSGQLAAHADPFHLSLPAQHIINDALPRGAVSSLAVSEFLIEQKLVHSKRMSTGKPDIYIAVAAYMDKLAAEGQCRLVSTSAEDRVYAKVQD